MSLTLNSRIKLCDGNEIPVIGFGTYSSIETKTAEKIEVEAIKCAVKCGYRHIDTAWLYKSEKLVGDALHEIMQDPLYAHLKRENFFLTSKLWNSFHSADMVRKGLEQTLRNLRTEYLDLYLIHWPIAFQEGEDPMPKDENGNIIFSDVNYLETYRAMEQLVKEGRVKSIGLSNFNISQMENILKNCEIKPVVNQFEVHPYLQNDKWISFCQNNGIQVVSYGTMGARDVEEMRHSGLEFMLDNEHLVNIGKKYNKSPAQICLRWALQRGLAVIPKSVNCDRIADNIDIFDFELNDEDMSHIKSINKNYRIYHADFLKKSPFYPFNE